MRTQRERWYGNAGHFICAPWCRFHLCTHVGSWLVSTVGDYHSITQMRLKRERTEPEEIGHGRKYETMVFRAGKPCDAKGCACGLPEIDGSELDFAVYNDAGAATAGHYRLLAKWRRRKALKAAR